MKEFHLVNTTIDQWEVLEAVVKLGSFGAAAARMNRSQSTISYAISRLQESFEVPLLEIKGRKAYLTETGKALLAEAQPLLTGFRALEERAASLGAGGKTQIHLSVDSLYPDDKLFAILSRFSQAFPYVHLKLRRGAILSTTLEFANHQADICVVVTPTGEDMLKPVLDIRIKAVARRDHLLIRDERELTQTDLVQSLAVIIEGATEPVRNRQPHAPSQRHLCVPTIESAIEAVRSGMCFGWLPVYRIQSYLDSGEFKELKLPLGGERFARIFLILREFNTAWREQIELMDMLGRSREMEVI
jgi:DNA-binding transcriptional LysR family regulator